MAGSKTAQTVIYYFYLFEFKSINHFVLGILQEIKLFGLGHLVPFVLMFRFQVFFRVSMLAKCITICCID